MHRIMTRALGFLLIAGFGIGLMLAADSFELMVASGIAYIILMCAVIVVAAADIIEQSLKAHHAMPSLR